MGIDKKPNVTFDDVMKLDMRICSVISAERVPKSDKLIKLSVLGECGNFETVTNLGEFYEPEDFSGKEFPFIINMEPRKIFGVQAEGMIVAGTLEGKPVFLDKMLPFTIII